MSKITNLQRPAATLAGINAGIDARPVPTGLACSIAASVQRGTDQPAGVGANSRQPVSGVPRGGGHPDPGASLGQGGDTPRCESGLGGDAEEGEESINGSLPGETDYLEAHDLVRWEDAPFGATAWAIGRGPATAQNPDPKPIARWLWYDLQGELQAPLADDYGVKLHPGRGMTLKRPPGLEAIIAGE